MSCLNVMIMGLTSSSPWPCAGKYVLENPAWLPSGVWSGDPSGLALFVLGCLIGMGILFRVDSGKGPVGPALPGADRQGPSPSTDSPGKDGPSAASAPPQIDPVTKSLQELSQLKPRISTTRKLLSYLFQSKKGSGGSGLPPQAMEEKIIGVGPDNGPLRLVGGLEGKVQRNRELAQVQGNLFSSDKQVRLLYVGSNFPGEGKTTAAISMAFGLSQKALKGVLLIDGNTDRPKLHQHFATSQEPGLINVLQGKVGFNEVLRPTVWPKLTVMTHGTQEREFNSVKWKKELKDLLDHCREQYDFVVYDGHAILSSPDAPFTANLFDGVILVVECEKTKLEVVNMTREKIEKVGSHILGLVMNRRKYYIPRFLYGKI